MICFPLNSEDECNMLLLTLLFRVMMMIISQGDEAPVSVCVCWG